jgi:hypothetical protein
MKTFKYTALLILIVSQSSQVVEGNVENLPVRIYTIREEIVNKAGVKGMTVNGSIPGPVLNLLKENMLLST